MAVLSGLQKLAKTSPFILPAPGVMPPVFWSMQKNHLISSRWCQPE
ncbi:hypothetical protein CSB66_2177 [Enterobacter hormaechei]|nr:hypothetical protein CSC35_0152 [Enterobacter hormaechei]RCG81365.1 hypothetical protein CSB66_2177 [Enterobacter hormaechei]